MARKSRKQIAVEEPVIESVSSEVFSTAIYARLSVENSGKSEKVDVMVSICLPSVVFIQRASTLPISSWS